MLNFDRPFWLCCTKYLLFLCVLNEFWITKLSFCWSFIFLPMRPIEASDLWRAKYRLFDNEGRDNDICIVRTERNWELLELEIWRIRKTGNTKKYEKIRKNTKKYEKVLGSKKYENTKKYENLRKNTKKYEWKFGPKNTKRWGSLVILVPNCCRATL